jgi:hypothetical protein
MKKSRYRANPLTRVLREKEKVMGWFGPGKREIWQEVARRTGGVFVPGGFWKDDRVQVPIEPWTITLDTYTVSAGQHSHITYTRIRAPYLNPDAFRFKIYRKSLFSELGKLFGMQDIPVEDPRIVEKFVVKGNDEIRVRELLADASLCDLVVTVLKGRLEVRDKEGWFQATYPPDADLLYYQVQGVLRDLDQLLGLVDLFAVCLDRLDQIGAAVRDDPGVAI